MHLLSRQVPVRISGLGPLLWTTIMTYQIKLCPRTNAPELVFHVYAYLIVFPPPSLNVVCPFCATHLPRG